MSACVSDLHFTKMTASCFCVFQKSNCLWNVKTDDLARLSCMLCRYGKCQNTSMRMSGRQKLGSVRGGPEAAACLHHVYTSGSRALTSSDVVSPELAAWEMNLNYVLCFCLRCCNTCSTGPGSLNQAGGCCRTSQHV